MRKKDLEEQVNKLRDDIMENTDSIEDIFQELYGERGLWYEEKGVVERLRLLEKKFVAILEYLNVYVEELPAQESRFKVEKRKK